MDKRTLDIIKELKDKFINFAKYAKNYQTPKKVEDAFDAWIDTMPVEEPSERETKKKRKEEILAQVNIFLNLNRPIPIELVEEHNKICQWLRDNTDHFEEIGGREMISVDTSANSMLNRLDQSYIDFISRG